MAKGTITIKELTQNGGTVASPHTIVAADGALIHAGGNTRKLVIVVKNSGTALPGTVTVTAGANPPAWRQGLGDLTVVVPVSSERLILVESARFAQADGDIYLAFSASINSELAYAYRLPVEN
jgi:hypothetical protein